MKKIISLLCVVAVLLSTMACMTAFAEKSDVDISVKLNKYEYSEEFGAALLYVDVVLDLPDLSAAVNAGNAFAAKWNGKLLQTMSWGLKYDAEKLIYGAGLGVDSNAVASATETTAGTIKAVSDASTDYTKWYAGGDAVWTLCFMVLDQDYAPEFEITVADTAAAIVTYVNAKNTVSNDSNTSVYKVSVTEATGNQYPLSTSSEAIASYNDTVNVGPVIPTAADLGLFTDASQNFKVAEKVMTSNGYSIEKALGFVSGIYADAAVVTYGTEITCEGFDKVLEIPAVNTYEAMENVKGFVAAVTSIRNDNLNKTFTAKAYADVTVGEETVRIYAEEAATAVYGN